MQEQENQNHPIPKRRFARRAALALILALIAFFGGAGAALYSLSLLGHLPSWEALIINEREPHDEAAAASAARIASLEKRILALEKKIAGNLGYPPAAAVALEEDLARLKTRLAKDVASLRARVASPSESAGAVSLAAYVALERAALQARPFDRELAALRLMRPGDAILKRLSEKKTAPPPTRETLKNAFAEARQQWMRDMRRGGADGAGGAKDDSLWERLQAILSNFVQIRRAGLWKGEDAPSLLAAMAFFLKKGALQEAVAKGEILEAKEDAPQAPLFRAWMRKARDRLALEKDLSLLSNAILSDIASLAAGEEQGARPRGER